VSGLTASLQVAGCSAGAGRHAAQRFQSQYGGKSVSTDSTKQVRERLSELEKDPPFVAQGLKVTFAEDLTRLLEVRGLKEAELARKLGANLGFVTGVLDTENKLTVETMARIALALDARITLRMLPREEAEHDACAQATPRELGGRSK